MNPHDTPQAAEPSPNAQHANGSTDPFQYGWRYVNRVLPDGTVELDEVPLTLEDVLHPQEEDHISYSNLHEKECGDVARVFRSRGDRLKDPLVLADCRVDWAVEGLRAVSPDITAFDHVGKPVPFQMGTFHPKEYGAGGCLLAVEVVSPHMRNNDVERKPPIYHQVGVPLYIIVDQKVENGPRQLLPYRNTPDGYVLEPLDEQGRFLVKVLGLYLSLRDNRLVCHDADTGKELGDYATLTQQVRESEQALEDAAHHFEEEVLARHAAEKLAREQEKLADQRAAALNDAEKRIQHLLAELQRLGGQAPQ